MTNAVPTCVALIPARGGSRRVPGKNIRELCGRPLLHYAIDAALDSGVFSEVAVSSDCPRIREIAAACPVTVIERPAAMATETSPDIDWVLHALESLAPVDCFSILRPTNPLRSAETIRRAWQTWLDAGPRGYDSLRAVELCTQHPAKMWRIQNDALVPLLLQPESPAPWHSQQYAALPEVYVQNASLEIAWRNTVMEKNSIAGDVILPFRTQDLEGFDINTELDWALAELLVSRSPARNPAVKPAGKIQ